MSSVLTPDKELYLSIRTAERVLVESHILPPRSGKAWKVLAGSIVRISTPEGPQVADLNLWNMHNPRERFWASRTRQLHASHVTTFDRLWSCLPFLRPMVTIIDDSIGARRGHVADRWGGRCHDLLGTRCDPYVDVMLSGHSYDFHCHSNLTRAVIPHGLTEFDVHDVLNVFQVTGLDKEGRYFMEASPAEKEDYIEVFAEQSLLIALSTCPHGDMTMWAWGEDDTNGRMLKCCRPLKIEIFRLADEKLLDNWSVPGYPCYSGRHGMSVPLGEITSV